MTVVPPKIYLASDYRGIQMRAQLLDALQSASFDVEDLGIEDGSTLDYVDISKRLAKTMDHQSHALGIIICGSGQGVSIALNRYPHMRAIVCRAPEDAQQGREKLKANTICLGCKNTSPEEALKIIHQFIAQDFSSSKHATCVQKLNGAETAHHKAGVNLIVRAMIIQEGHILLTTPTGTNKDFSQGLYFLPGGHVDHNEPAHEALSREIREEMGLVVNDAVFRGVLECSWNRKESIYHELDIIYEINVGPLSIDQPPLALDHGFHKFVWKKIGDIQHLHILPERLKEIILNTTQEKGESPFLSQMIK